MSKTVVGLFSSFADANKMKSALVSEGFDSSSITVVANDEADADYSSSASSSSMGTSASSGASSSNEGIGQKISNFFHGLTGGDEDVHGHYASGVNSGGALVAVNTSDERASSVASLLKQYGARDIDNDNVDAAEAGVPVYGGSAAITTGDTAIPVVEEELVVGKREVDRGGVRIYSRVVEQPVSADVTLREEHVNVTRRAVDRVATAADFEAGRGATVELTAMGEEAVVGKSARVVEEILVGKESSQRTEAIHDTVRRTEVEVEDIPVSGTTTTRTDRY